MLSWERTIFQHTLWENYTCWNEALCFSVVYIKGTSIWNSIQWCFIPVALLKLLVKITCTFLWYCRLKRVIVLHWDWGLIWSVQIFHQFECRYTYCNQTSVFGTSWSSKVSLDKKKKTDLPSRSQQKLNFSLESPNSQLYLQCLHRASILHYSRRVCGLWFSRCVELGEDCTIIVFILSLSWFVNKVLYSTYSILYKK